MNTAAGTILRPRHYQSPALYRGQASYQKLPQTAQQGGGNEVMPRLSKLVNDQAQQRLGLRELRTGGSRRAPARLRFGLYSIPGGLYIPGTGMLFRRR